MLVFKSTAVLLLLMVLTEGHGQMASTLGDCGTSLGCFRFPETCTEIEGDCQRVLTWKFDEETGMVNFDLSRSGAADGSYVAVGLSKNRNMPGTSVTGCITSGGSVLLHNSFNNGYNNVPLESSDLTTGLSISDSSMNDGVLRCQFTREVTVDHDQIYDLEDSYFLILAIGSVYGEQRLGQHSQLPDISSMKIDLKNITLVVGSESDNVMLKIHACLMIFAWLFCAGLAIIFARYYRAMWPDTKICGKPVWFIMHVSLQVLNVLVNIGAFVVIFVHVKGMSEYKNGSPKVARVHPIVGIIVFGLTLIQPCMAAFRPHPDADNRYLFNWAHWLVGTLAHYGAVFNIFLGLARSSAANIVEDWLKWVVLGYICMHVLVQLILEVVKHCNGESTYETKNGTVKQKKSGFLNFMLVCYILCAWGCGAAVIVNISYQ